MSNFPEDIMVVKRINSYSKYDSEGNHKYKNKEVYIKTTYDAYVYQSTIDKFEHSLYILFMNLLSNDGFQLETLEEIDSVGNRIIYFKDGWTEVDVTDEYNMNYIDNIANNFSSITFVMWD